MQYFLDNCLSPRFALMLRALGEDVVALKEEIPANTKDVAVFQYLEKTGRVFVSLDRKQLTRVAEVSELRSLGISAIYFGPFWASMDFWQQAAWIVSRWKLIDGTQRGIAKGAVVEIKRNGKAMLIPA